MDDKIFIAIIAAASALLGSLIPTIINYLNSKEQRNFEIQKDLINKQKEIYLELMLSLQDMINHQKDSSKFYNLQQAAIKASLYGDNKTSAAFYNYYDNLVKSSLGKRESLTTEENHRHQTEILNSIRQAMGLNTFDKFAIVGFHPDNT